MVSEGVVAEDENLLASMRRIGHLMDISQEELMALLDYYCDPELPLLPIDDAQVLVGIESESISWTFHAYSNSPELYFLYPAREKKAIIPIVLAAGGWSDPSNSQMEPRALTTDSLGPDNVLAKGVDLHHSIRRPLFRHLFCTAGSGKPQDEYAAAAGGSDWPALLKSASTTDDAAALVTSWLSAKLAQLLGIPGIDIDTTRPVHAYGIDSLVAIDLRNWFEREIGARIEIFTLMGNISLEELAARAARDSLYRG